MCGKAGYGQQRERALLDGGGPVRRGGYEKDGRSGQHRSGAREGQRQPDGARSGGLRGDSDDRQQRQEQVVEALVERQTGAFAQGRALIAVMPQRLLRPTLLRAPRLPPARGEDGLFYKPVEGPCGQHRMGCDQRLGAEADEVAGPGPFRVDGPRNRSHHDVGVGHHLARILAAHAFRSLGRRLLIRPALRGLGEVVGGDVPPFGFDSAGFDEHDVNAELGRLHAQRVRKGLHRVLCGVVPASHECDEPPAHARDVDDRARSPLAHLGHDGLRQSGEAEDVDVELAARFVDLDVFDRSEGSVARVVHQHVDASAFGDDPPDGVLSTRLAAP